MIDLLFLKGPESGFFINNFYHYADLCLSDDKVLNHEAIITTIAHKNSEKFKTFIEQNE